MALRFITLLAGTAATEQRANPIRKVVKMLNMMAEKVEAEGKRQDKLFEAYMCYCKQNDAEVSKAVETANERIPQLQATVKESNSMKSQLQTELKDHKADRVEGLSAIEKANSLRAKEVKQYDQDVSDLKTNIVALGKAIQAIEKNMAASFLQSSSQIIVQIQAMMEMNLSIDENDRSQLMSFLSTGTGESGEILGILKTMKEEMEKDLAKIISEENERTKAHQELITSKKKEITSTTSTIENKTERVGVLAVKESESLDDLEETSSTLENDQEFLVNLREGCEQQKKDHTLRQKTRSEEITAIAETIKVLNSDDALELFKKTLPSPEVSLIQLHTTTKSQQQKALHLIRHLPEQRVEVSLIEMGLKTKKVDFGKISVMIKDLIVVLKQEQKDDDAHKAYCTREFDVLDDKQKTNQRDISGHSSQKEELKGAITQLISEIKTLQTGIVDLDKAVAEATEQRKKENSEFTQTQSENQASLGLLEFAKNRLAKFYDPKLYKAPKPQEMSESDRIYQNSGGEIETQAPGGISGTGITVLQAPPKPDNYKKQESGGVIEMINLLTTDLRTEMAEADTEEKHSQEEYEKLMKEAQKKRKADSEAITGKETAKAYADEAEQDTMEALGESKAALAAVTEAIADLHASCDFLLENYNTRKTARQQEIEGLAKAQSTLAGANFSFGQGFLMKNE